MKIMTILCAVAVMLGMDGLIFQEILELYALDLGLIYEFIFLEWYNSNPIKIPVSKEVY